MHQLLIDDSNKRSRDSVLKVIVCIDVSITLKIQKGIITILLICNFIYVAFLSIVNIYSSLGMSKCECVCYCVYFTCITENQSIICACVCYGEG